MNNLLKASGILLMWGAFYAAVQAGLAEQKIADSAKAITEASVLIPGAVDHRLFGIEEDLKGELDTANAQILGFRLDLNKHLGQVTSQIAIGRSQLLQQTADTLTHADKTIDAATNVLASGNVVVSNPEIPKLIHDARLTTAFAGQAAIHLEGMANDLDKATPGFLKSAQQLADSGVKLAGSGADIAGDVQVVTDKATAPKPWYSQVAGYALPFVKIGSVFF